VPSVIWDRWDGRRLEAARSFGWRARGSLTRANQRRLHNVNPCCGRLGLEIVILFDSGAARRSTCSMSLPKLTSLSTQTLSLLLERQRLQTLSPSPRSAGLTQAPQITKNLTQLRAGIIELEENEGRTEAVTLLRSQFERMRSMLGDGGHVERYVVSNSSSASGTLL
jgi:hypothetical protein